MPPCDRRGRGEAHRADTPRCVPGARGRARGAVAERSNLGHRVGLGRTTYPVRPVRLAFR